MISKLKKKKTFGESKDGKSPQKEKKVIKLPKQTLSSIIKQLADNDPNLTLINLPKVSLGESNVSEFCKYLAVNQTVTYVNISHNYLRDRGAKWIAFVIKKNSTLRDLDLSFNSLTPEGVKNIVEAVRKNFTLLRVIIREVPIQGSFATDELCPRIQRATMDLTDILKENMKIAKVANRKTSILRMNNREIIKSPPSFIGNISHLTLLSLQKNQIEDISSLMNLSALKEMNLANNMITIIPNDIKNLQGLEILILSDNKIQYLPSSVSSLPKLSHLDIRNNAIYSLECFPSRRLSQSNTLKILKLSGNPIISEQSFIPSFILESDAEPLLEYLRKISVTNTRNYRAKIIVLGDHQTGKTSLLKSLITLSSHKLIADDKSLSTQFESMENEVVSIHKWVVDTKKVSLGKKSQSSEGVLSVSKTVFEGKNDKKNTIKIVNANAVELDENYQSSFIEFHCWDFQKKEESSHLFPQFFFSQNTIYLVVFSLEEVGNLSSVEEKIKAIQTYGGSDPIIFVIGTHFETHRRSSSPTLNFSSSKEGASYCFKKLNRKYPIVKKYFAVSNVTGAGVNQLKSAIISYALSLPHLGQTISQKIFYLEECFEDQVTNAPFPIVNLSYVRDIAEKCKMKEDQIIPSLSFLAQIGSIVYFNDVKPQGSMPNLTLLSTLAAVGENIFLSPQYLSSLFDHVFQKINVEKLSEKEMIRIWNEDVNDKYPLNLIPIFLSILERFDIICPMYTSKGDPYWLIPQYLSSDPPSIIADLPPDYDRNVWRRIVHFRSLPDYFFPRLITRLVRNIGGKTIYWKTGIMFIMNAPEEDDLDADLSENSKKEMEKRMNKQYISEKQIAFLLYNPVDVEIYLEVPANHAGSHLLFDLMSNVITACNDIKKTILVPCNDCIVNHGKSVNDAYHFKWHELENLASEGSSFISCYYNTLFPQPILIESLAPDITLNAINHLKIDFQSIDLKEVVGEGGFGTVYRAVLKGDVVAAKIMKISSPDIELTPLPEDEGGNGDNSENPFAEFRREVLLMAGLKNDYLVQLKGISMNPLVVITDYCRSGDLYHLCNSSRSAPLPMGYLLCVALDIARGMAFLHGASPPIVHRDLKSPNVLLMMTDDEFDEKPYMEVEESLDVDDHHHDEDDSRKTGPNISDKSKTPLTRLPIAKISDFGLSTKSSLPSEGRLVDNPLWLAPEVIRSLPYSTKADVYSFGIILWELHSCQIPFAEFNIRFSFQLEDKICEGLRPTVPERCLQSMAALMTACWDQDPANRPDFHHIVDAILLAQQDIHFYDPSHNFYYDDSESSSSAPLRKFVIVDKDNDNDNSDSQIKVSDDLNETSQVSDDETSVIYNLKKKKKKKKQKQVPKKGRGRKASKNNERSPSPFLNRPAYDRSKLERSRRFASFDTQLITHIKGKSNSNLFAQHNNSDSNNNNNNNNTVNEPGE